MRRSREAANPDPPRALDNSALVCLSPSNPGELWGCPSAEFEPPFDNTLRRKVDLYRGPVPVCGKLSSGKTNWFWYKLQNGITVVPENLVLSREPYHMKHLTVLTLCLKNWDKFQIKVEASYLPLKCLYEHLYFSSSFHQKLQKRPHFLGLKCYAVVLDVDLGRCN